jgi:hypothetical protein
VRLDAVIPQLAEGVDAPVMQHRTPLQHPTLAEVIAVAQFREIASVLGFQVPFAEHEYRPRPQKLLVLSGPRIPHLNLEVLRAWPDGSTHPLATVPDVVVYASDLPQEPFLARAALMTVRLFEEEREVFVLAAQA